MKWLRYRYGYIALQGRVWVITDLGLAYLNQVEKKET